MSATELKEALEEIKKTWHSFKEINERQDKEIKEFGEVTQETKTQLEKINEKLSDIEAKGIELEKKMQRSRFMAGASEKSNVPEAHLNYKNAFFGGLRNLGLGNELTPEQRKWMLTTADWTPEMKALSTDSDTTGGYLAPPEYINEIIKGVVEFSPVRELARVSTTTRKSIQVPVRKGTSSAYWVSERESRDRESAPSYGMEDIPAHEMIADVRISYQELEDAVFNMESEIQMDIQEQFGVAEGTALISGSGVKKPEGLLTNSDVGVVNSGDASTITADSLIAIFFELKDMYARNASWLLKRSTLKTIRQFKDGQGQYLWQPGIAGTATPATILDRPYREAVDMPTVEANATPILFGDFRRGYRIVDRIQIQIQRLNELHALDGQVGFLARKRVGGQVVLAEAIKKLKVAA